tara:strand:+ start:3440 stop:3544 length:105 start_codon:yes stop_codon:yes gene_type:complete
MTTFHIALAVLIGAVLLKLFKMKILGIKNKIYEK